MLRNVTCVCAVLMAVSWAQAEVVIETVTVGNPGNANDIEGDGYGGVDYAYQIGTFEVTAGQYAEFLNAVAATDTYGLYNTSMDSSSYGCQITQNGTNGSYTYDFSGGTVEAPGSTAADWENRPVNHVSWGDAARFANWLHNGQPTGSQGPGTTEDGAYFLDDATSNAELLAIAREPDATWVIPSEDEWYKAAYYDGGSGLYYDYPAGSDSVPVAEACPGGSNSENYYGTGWAVDPPYYRNPVGCYVGSASPYGTFDQGGNIFEWNEAVVGSYRGLRGGSFNSNDISLLAAQRNNNYPTIEYDGVGFRLANVEDSVVIPAVSTWGLAILGILVLTVGTVLVNRRRVAGAVRFGRNV